MNNILRHFLWGWVVLLAPFTLHAVEPDLGTDSQRATGKKLYLKQCAHCHGIEGDGQGFAQKTLKPWPRNFTKGIFKFKSTTGDRLPQTKDIEQVIRRGNAYTGMPAWPDFSDAEVTSLAYFIKTFSEDFSDPEVLADEDIAPIPMKPPASTPDWSEASAENGKLLFKEQKCIDCHGPFGRGSGSSALDIEDMDGNHLRPRDLTKRWTFRNGHSREDIFRTITTGVNPMPNFEELPEAERWNLVDFVYSLGKRDDAEYGTVITAIGAESIDLSQGESLFANAISTYLPVIGQITQPGRAFYASTNGVEVKSVFNEEEIAFLLIWHDMSAERTGTNSPLLEVPRFGEEQPIEETSQSDSEEEEEGFGEEEDEEEGEGFDEEEDEEEGEGFDEEEDDTDSVTTKSKFSDAVAIQVPSVKPLGPPKPYFIFGDNSQAVDLWFADLAGDKAQAYRAKGAGNIVEIDDKIEFVSNYNEGRWTVIFKRKRIKEQGISFIEKDFTPIAFSFWDGFNQERGNKHGLTLWFHVYLKPLKEESIIAKMAMYAFLILVLELGVVYYVRKKFGAKK